MNKSIYVVGPTASGKSRIAIALAQECDGEVISSDSRQIFRGLDIGSGKEPGRLSESEKRGKHTKTAYMIDGIPHYLIDTHHPNTVFSAGKFVKRAGKIQEDIWKRNKLPIIAGGTMFWAQALAEDDGFPNVAPNEKLRTKLKKQSTEALMKKLIKADTRRANMLLEAGDHRNKPRLIRALEIGQTLGSVPATRMRTHTSENLIIAVSHSRERLFARIEKRMDVWFDDDIFQEIKHVHYTMGVPWTRLESFGLEYKWCTQYVRGHIDFDTMRQNTLRDLKKYAKRQETWLNRWEKIAAGQKNTTFHRVPSLEEAKKMTKKFLGI